MSMAGRLPIGQFATPTLAADQFYNLRLTSSGELVVNISSSGTLTVIGTATPSDSFNNPTTAVTTWSLLGGWDGSRWFRLQAGQSGTVVAANVGLTLNVLPTAVYVSAVPTLTNGQGHTLRLNVSGELIVVGSKTPADAFANPTDALTTLSLLAGFNGTTWDRALLGLSTAVSSGDLAKVLNVLSTAKYNSTQPTLSNGEGSILQVNSRGELITAQGVDPTLFTDFGANATASVKGSAGRVLSFSCNNGNSSIRYLQLHNKASAASNGEVPLLVFPIPGSSVFSIGTDFFTNIGVAFSTGIAFAFSTTQGTYTAGSAGDQFTQITYR